MGVIEHSTVIENAVTLGGGGGDLTPPVTVNTATAVPAPLEVVLTDAATTTAPPLLGLTHRAPAGGDVGLGAGLLFRMDRDDATLGTAAQLTAAWSDPAGTAQLLFRVYDGTPVTALTLTPFGCYLPAASAEPPTPTAGVAVWSDAGVLHYKGPDGVPHATGSGNLMAPATLTGADPATTPLTVEAAAAQTAPYVIIKRDADWQGGTMIEGQDETTAQLWYADENGDVWASRDLLAGRNLSATGSLTAGANSTITGSLGVTSLHSSGAVDGASATITGAVGAGSATITGNVGAGSMGVTAGVTVGTTVQVGNGTSAGVMVNVDGSIQVFNSSAPGTPTGGGVFWVESGALKYKGSSGTVTTLAPA